MTPTEPDRDEAWQEPQPAEQDRTEPLSQSGDWDSASTDGTGAAASRPYDWGEDGSLPPPFGDTAIEKVYGELGRQARAAHDRQRRPPPPQLVSIDRYRIDRWVGTGGFGHVYRAIDKLTGNPVAIKIPREDKPAHYWTNNDFWAGQKVHHLHVVVVHHTGEFNGRPYLVSEFIEGPSLAEWLKQRGPENLLPFRAAVSLVSLLASGVECCHLNGVLHRDLKPANVLLQVDSRMGPAIEGLTERLVPRITDFGLSRELDANLESGTLDRAGTAAYMAPEQAEGRKDQGRAVDIHALGVILYELLTGALPYRGESEGEIVRKLLHSEPRSPRLLRSKLSRDLETICLKCLEKAPEKRYATAADLEADLKAFLDGRPISARPVSRLERAVRWAKRKPREAALALTAMLATLALVGGTAYFIAIQAEQNRKLAWSAVVGAVQQAVKQEAAGDLERASQTLLDLRKTISPSLDLGFAHRALWHKIDRRLSFINSQEDNELNELLLFPSGNQYLLAISNHQDHSMAVWDPISGQRLARTPLAREQMSSYQGDPTSFWMFSHVPRNPIKETALQHHDINTLEIKNLFAFPPWVKVDPVVAPFHENFLFIGSSDTKLCEIRDATNFAKLNELTLDAEPLAALASPDSQSVALMLGADQFDGKRNIGESSLQLLTTVNGNFRVARVAGPFLGFQDRRCLAFSPDGSFVAIATDHPSTGGLVCLVNLGTGEIRVLAQAPGAGLVAFSPDGRLLAYGIKDGGIEVRSVATGELRQTLNSEAFCINGLAFSPDGQTLYSIPNQDNRIWCWHLDAQGRLNAKESAPIKIAEMLPAEVQNGFVLFSAAFSPDSRSMALGGENGVLWVSPSTSPREGRFFRLGDNGLTAMRYFQNGQRLALGSWDRSGDITIIKPQNGQIERVLRGHTNAVRTLDVNPDGGWLASGSKDGTVRLWDLTDLAKPGKIIKQSMQQKIEDIRCVAFSPDGQYLAIGDNGFEQSVYDLTTNQQVYSAMGSHSVQAVAFSPEGDLIAFGDNSGSITLLSWPKKKTRVLRAHSGNGGVLGLDFHPNGKELASCGDDGSVAIWDTTSGGDLLREKVLTGEVRSIAFSPDGFTLVAVDEKGHVSLLEAPALVDFGVGPVGEIQSYLKH